MNWIKIDINKNNTIIEISGGKFLDLLANEIEIETDYDFPTSQPLMFYKWDGMNVVINDEETIRTFYEETASGLDLEPHIENIVNSDFEPTATKIISIMGINFSPFSTVEISGVGNFVNTVYFDSPKQLRVEITVGTNEGLFNIIVYNADLQSKESGFNKILIKTKITVDLRSEPIVNLGLEMTSGINVEQDTTNGLRFSSSTSSWNRGVKFGSYFWNRTENITFEIIFTRTSDVLFMLGIASKSLDISTISSAYYKQEIGMYNNNNSVNTFYGGGDVTNWNQNIGKTISFDVNKFYKLKFENSGGDGAECHICEVDENDWDNETVLYTWISNNPADDIILTPFLLPQAGSGAYYITGFRY